MTKVSKIVVRIGGISIEWILIAFILFAFFIRTSIVQTYLAQKATAYLSKELKTTVYHTNFHSFGYSNRVQWLTSNMTDVKFINIYKFIPERNLSRGIARKIIDEKKDENYVCKNYGFRKFDLNDPIAFEMAKVEKFNRKKKEMMEFIEKTIYKLQK